MREKHELIYIDDKKIQKIESALKFMDEYKKYCYNHVMLGILQKI